jgi:polyhydroxybutyrate depolymerase
VKAPLTCTIVLAVAASACGEGGATPPPKPSRSALVATRGYHRHIPANLDDSQPVPLVLALHFYAGTGPGMDSIFRWSKLADERNFIVAFPEGVLTREGERVWNFINWAGPPYDVDYVAGVVEDLQGKYNIDPKRIFATGYSHGGFMAHRVACSLADILAAVIPISGTAPTAPGSCAPANPVSVLHVHGKDDAIIYYDGGPPTYSGEPLYSSAPEALAMWTQRNACTGTPVVTRDLDLDPTLDGAETEVKAASGCATGGAAELWTIRGGAHLPQGVGTYAPHLYEWMLAHPKP